MVGDIIQDPMGEALGGAFAAGYWAVNQAIQAYQRDFNQLSGYGEDFLRGFTTDDLIDVPPPPAEDLGTVEPEVGTAGRTATGTKAPEYTWEDYVKDMYVQERDRGIQSPIGPEDPNFVLAPVPRQEQNKDPQAPLKPGFLDMPVPYSPNPVLAANHLVESKKLLHFGPEGFPGMGVFPVFNGEPGVKSTVGWNTADVYAVPAEGDDGSGGWNGLVQLRWDGEVTETWTFPSGPVVPEPSMFQLLEGFDPESSYSDFFTTTELQPGEYVKKASAQVSAAPGLVTINATTPGSSAPPLISAANQGDWQPIGDQGTNPEVAPGANPSGTTRKVENPFFPVIPIPLPAPAIPAKAVPLTVNNPAVQPAIGGNGVPLPPKSTITTTPTDVHKIGNTLVGAGGAVASLTGVASEIGRIEQKIANQMRNPFDALDQLDDILDILDKLIPPPTTPGKTLSMRSYCNKDDEGNLEEMSIIYPPAEYLPAIISRLDDLPAWLEQHLAWKTPTCNEKPILQGQWVSTHWISDGNSPGSRRPLRKLFRYRTKSSRTNDQLQDFWTGFAWSAGPTLVQHKGAWWGTPAVWAVNAAEGKRVIRNAAREAGIDPDLDGEWVVGGSSSSRYGMKGTMRLAEQWGEKWITSRDGPSGPPEL